MAEAKAKGQQRRQRRGTARRARGADRGARGRQVQLARDLQVGERHAQPVRRAGLLRPRRRSRSTRPSSPSTPTIPRSSPPRTTARRRSSSCSSGLASCLTAGVAAVAQNREIQLRSVKATLEGEMDILGILGVDPEVRNGFDDIKVTFDIDADASRKDIEALVAQSQKRSAVFDIVTNPTNVTVKVRLTVATRLAERRTHAHGDHRHHRRRPRRPRDEPLPHRALDRPRRARARRGRELLAHASAGTRCGC